MSKLETSPPAPVSILRRPRDRSSGVAVFLVTIFIAIVALFQSPALLVLVGFLTILAGRAWFAAQILREMTTQNALLVLLMPFMPTLFFLQRIEITWKPFLYGIMGIVMLLTGVIALQISS